MELVELISAGKERIRGDSVLFAEYLRVYKGIFGSNSGCSACTFNSDFGRLMRYVEMNKSKTMGQKKVIEMGDKQEKTFLIYKEGKIRSYEKGGKIYRVYDIDMTEEFAVEYLTYGTSEELERRKKIFKVLPAVFEKGREVVLEESKIEGMSDLVEVGGENLKVEASEVKPPNKKGGNKKK